MTAPGHVDRLGDHDGRRGDSVIVSRAQIHALPVYHTSIPTGRWPGKMWRAFPHQNLVGRHGKLCVYHPYRQGIGLSSFWLHCPDSDCCRHDPDVRWWVLRTEGQPDRLSSHHWTADGYDGYPPFLVRLDLHTASAMPQP